MTRNGAKNIYENLGLPRKYDSDIEGYNSIDKKFKDVFGLIPGFDNESTKLFEATTFLTTTDNWKKMTQLEKVRSIWDIAQAYKYELTFSINKAIETRELECQLISYISGELIKKYIQDVKLAVIIESRHTKLAVSFDDGCVYIYDANSKKYKNFIDDQGVTDYYISTIDGREVGMTPSIKLLLERYFFTGFEQSMTVENIQNGFITVQDFDKGILPGIISNLVVYNFIKDKSIQIELLRFATEINPNYSEPWYNLGLYLKGEESIECYRKAIVINPNFSEAWNNLGTKLEGEKSIKCYEKAIEINPNFSEAWNNLGTKLEGEKSIKCYEKAIEINPNDPRAFYSLASLIDSDKKEEYVHEGYEAISKFIQLTKDDPDWNKTEYFENALNLQEFFQTKYTSE